MVWNTPSGQVDPMSAKWQLAERLTGYSEIANNPHSEQKLPETALQSIFNDTLEQLQKRRNITFSQEIKTRIWNKVSSKNLIMIKHIFISKFCDTILSPFNETKAQIMLEEHIKTGAIETHVYLIPLHLAIEEHKEPLRNFIYQQTNLLIPLWVPEIVSAVNKETEQLR